MSRFSVIFALVGIIGAILIGMSTDLSLYEGISVALMIFVFLNFLDNIGNKVVVLDIAVILATFTWLIMPVIFYHNYTKEDTTARLFNKYMPLSSDSYFSFVLPGTVAMIVGFKLPLARLEINNNSKAYWDRLKVFFAGKSKIGFILIGISLCSGVLRYVLPASISRIMYLMEHLSIVGVFYIFFSDHKWKMTIMVSVLGLVLLNSIKTGLFGELIYLLALFYILVAIYLKKISFFTKLGIVLAGIFLVFVLQSVKSAYRARTWLGGEEASASFFGELVVESVTNPSIMFEKKKLFSTAVRMNQGWLIGTTMDRVPRRFEFAGGETIWTSVAAAFIPRLFWPDKPESGGKANLKRFWGYDLHGYSMNIGSIGEAYANFDRTGGILFMFFYGLAFNALLTSLLKWSERRPSILCWIPVTFFYAVVVETDLLTTLSSVVTSIIFMLIFMRVWKWYFKSDL